MSTSVPSGSSAPVRGMWFVFGWLAVAVGTAGVFLPVLPTTGPFILAAWCFARSSPRFEAWVLSLPKVGRLVRDHRAGLGMPRRAKVVAMTMIVLASGSSIWRLWGRPVPVVGIALLAVVGVAYIGWRVPARERLVAARWTPGMAE